MISEPRKIKSVTVSIVSFDAICLFVCLWLGWVLVAVLGLSLPVVSGGIL